MKIAKALIESGLSDRGGLNGPQRAILGVTSSQSPFWVVGQEISPEYAARLVELRNQGKKQKRRAANPLPNEIAGLPGAAMFESEPDDDWYRLRFDGGCSTRPG